MKVIDASKPKVQKFTIEFTREELLSVYGMIAHSSQSLVIQDALSSTTNLSVVNDEFKQFVSEHSKNFIHITDRLYEELMHILDQ